MRVMNLRTKCGLWIGALLAPFMLLAPRAIAQKPPIAKNARILLLPRTMVSGERVTLAVLDMNGRLTPGATIAFSNGDHVTTNTTGRALFVAPLTPGALFATIQGRAGRLKTLVLPSVAEPSAAEIVEAPHFASLSDRFELQGHGFCGDADKNVVQMNGQPALVLAASSKSIAILPPDDVDAGPADVTVSCNHGPAGAARITLLSLALDADRSPMQPGEKRTLAVKISGSSERVMLEARNLAPAIVELTGGNPAKAISSGGAENIAVFPLTGKAHGNILVSIRLLPGAVHVPE